MTPAINRLIATQALRTLNFAGPIFTLFLIAKGLSLQQILTLASIILLSGMIFEIPTGVFGDRFGRKWSIVAGTMVAIIGWALWLSAQTFFGFASVYVLFGLANAFWSGSDQALIIDELKAAGQEDKTQKVFARYGAAMTAAYGVAALIGGLVAYVHTMANYYLLFEMTLAASVLSLPIVLTIKEKRATPAGHKIEHAPQSMLAQFGAGIRLLRQNTKLRKIVFYFIFTSALSFVLMDLYQVYFVRAQVPDSWFGFALGLSAFMVAFVKWYSYKIEQWFGVEWGLLITSLLPIILWTLMGLLFNPIAAVLLFLMTDAANNVRDPLIIDYQNRHIHGNNRATVLSTIALITSAFVVVLQPVIGAIADRSLSAAFFTTAGIIVFGVLFFRISKDDVTA